MSLKAGLSKLLYRRLSRSVKHTLPGLGFLAAAAAMFFFFLPPVTRLDLQPSNQKGGQTTRIRSPVPKATVPKASQPPAAAIPAPVPTSPPSKTVSPPAKATPPPVKPSPSSSVSNLTTPEPATTTPASSGNSGQPSSGGSGSSPAPSSSATDSYTSSNWAGYFAANGSYDAVSANWVAPDPSSSSAPGSADATWVGIGGITTEDLIQVGTDNIISASGQISTSAFYEMLPYSAVAITTLTISPGDQISAALNEVSPGIWTVSLTDNTTNQNFTTTVSYSSSLSSVEWIEEDPGNQYGQLYPLDEFGSVDFSNCLAGVNGAAETIAAADSNSVSMVDSSNQPVATPSVLGSDGASFNVSQP